MPFWIGGANGNMLYSTWLPSLVDLRWGSMDLDRQLVWLLAVAVGYGALVIPVTRKGTSRGSRVSLIVYILLSMSWALMRGASDWAVVSDGVQAIMYWGMAYGIVALSSLLGVLTTLFLGGDMRWLWIWPAAGGGVMLAMGMLDGFGTQWPAWSAVSSLSLSMSLAIAGWVGISGMAYFLSWNVYRHTHRPLYRNRLRYWLLVLILVLSGDSLFALFGFPYYEWGTMLHWLGTALASAVLSSYHLPDLGGVARHGIRYVLLTLLSALIFFGAICLAQYVVVFAPFTRNAILSTAGIALLLAILSPFLCQWMRRLFTRLLFGEGYSRERILREYSQGVSNILDLNVLATTAIGTISRAMKVRRGALLVCEEMPNLRLRPIQGMGTLDVEPIVVGPDSPPIVYMAETGMPLLQYDIDLLPQFQNLLPEERVWFSSLDMELYVPIRAQNQLLGILVLGAKGSGEAYSSGDIALLRTLAGQTAVALENARLVADLKRLNAEITQLNQDLTETNERLAILDKTKSDFISIASHELKTPLTHISGYTDMMIELAESEAIPSESVRAIIQGVSRGAKRLRDVVDAMLDVSLIETEAFTIHPISISLEHVIEQVLGGVEDAIRDRHQTIAVSGLETLPDILGDEIRLHQAFRNVIVNGIKFTPDGGQIGIRARTMQEAKQVEIAIADTGIGIDPEHQELIFAKFYRVGDLNLHSTGQTKFKGAGPGLGLPIARGIIEAHGGKVWVESDGHDEETFPGSTFYVLLPVDGPTSGQGQVKI